MLSFIFYGIGILLIVMGILSFFFQKTISGYSQMPDEMRPKVKKMVASVYIFGGIATILSVFVCSLMNWIGATMWAVMAICFITCIIMLVQQNKLYEKYKYVSCNNSKSSKIAVWTIVIVVVGSMILILYGTKEHDVVIQDNQIKISGMYGTDIKLNDIQSFELLDKMPSIKTRTNGFGTSSTKKGYFDVEGEGNCLLFIKGNEKYVKIKTNDKTMYINFKNTDKTIDLYNILANSKK